MPQPNSNRTAALYVTAATKASQSYSGDVSYKPELSQRFSELDVCLSVLRCICVDKKNQLDATEWFIALIICSTRFGHFYAHHKEIETICVLLPPMVCDALVARCWRSGAEQPAALHLTTNDQKTRHRTP